MKSYRLRAAVVSRQGRGVGRLGAFGACPGACGDVELMSMPAVTGARVHAVMMETPRGRCNMPMATM